MVHILTYTNFPGISETETRFAAATNQSFSIPTPTLPSSIAVVKSFWASCKSLTFFLKSKGPCCFWYKTCLTNICCGLDVWDSRASPNNIIYYIVRMYVCMYVCMHACMHGCMYVCMHAWMDVCMHACMHGCMYVCMYACMDGCM